MWGTAAVSEFADVSVVVPDPATKLTADEADGRLSAVQRRLIDGDYSLDS